MSEPHIETVRDVTIGINATGTRREFDSMGDVDVPADRYWGAQTERSLHHFDIGSDRMPKAVYHAYGFVKKACALVNATAGRLPDWKRDAIVRAADETALSPVIGYQNAAHIAEKAIAEGTTLREAALSSNKVDAAHFDGIIKPLNMSATALLALEAHGDRR
jgi:fumarate hydratase class II